MSSPPAFRKTVITRLLDASSLPAYMVDDRRRIIYANQSLADWLKTDRDSLAGVTCDYVADSNSPVAGLCPPPSAFEGLETNGLIHSPASAAKPVAVRFLPVTDGGGETAGVIVLSIPRTKVADSTPPSDAVEKRLHDVLMQSRHRDAGAHGVFPLVGTSPAICRARRQFNIAVGSFASVLVSASSSNIGERVARAIHARRHPDGESGLVPLACPLLDAELVRTTLTAFMQRCAELETETPPTLLLLDVEQLSTDAQSELSGFLAIEELALQTLTTSSLPYDQLCQVKGFREDLAASLSTLEIDLPHLKQRPTDVPLVVQAALESHNSHAKHQLEGFDTEALEQLVAYPWPGDLREVEEIIGKAAKSATAAPARRVFPDHLPREVRLGLDAASLPNIDPPALDLDKLLFDIERKLVVDTLEATRQNRAEAARRLGISRNKLLRRIAQLGLEDGDAGNGENNAGEQDSDGHNGAAS